MKKNFFVAFFIAFHLNGISQKDSSYILIGYFSKESVGTAQYITKDFPSKEEMKKRVSYILKKEDFIICSVSIFDKKQWYNYIKK